MRTLLFMLLFASAASGQTYQVGTANAHRYDTTTTTTACNAGRWSASCDTAGTTNTHALYYLTFAEGFTRELDHVSFKPDPLKGIEGPTPVKYRLQKKYGIQYVHILAANGKEGIYFFSSSDDAPEKIAKQAAKDAKDAPAPVD
jgi:hypothetical protein